MLDGAIDDPIVGFPVGQTAIGRKVGVEDGANDGILMDRKKEAKLGL